MTTFIRGVLAFLLIFLVSCAHYPVRQANASCNGCTIVCEQRAAACNTVCRNSCPNCTAFAKQSAAKAYVSYQHEQHVKGEKISRELQSYRDPLQCRKVTCDCRADYQICVQACHGVVSKQLRSARVC